MQSVKEEALPDAIDEDMTNLRYGRRRGRARIATFEI
jgi:hypothetical protein